MKTIFLSLILLLVSPLVYAQSNVALLGKNKTAAKERAFTKSKANPDRFFEHNRRAMLALRRHFSEHIEYPEIMQQYGVEGTAVVEVRISEWGRVEEAKVLKGISPLFDEAIMDAMESLDYVYAKGRKYLGWRKMQLPVVFSLR